MATPPPNRSKAVALSNLLFALVLIAAAVVAYLYFFDNRFFNEGPEAPTCEHGRNELICVVNGLRAEDVKDVDLGRYTATANQLDQPGQVIEIGDNNAFLFIYPAGTPEEAIAAREADGADLDAETLLITARISERPLNEGEEVHIFQHSNVILIYLGDNQDDIEKIQRAVDALP